MPLTMIWTDTPAAVIEIKDAAGNAVAVKGVDLDMTRADLMSGDLDEVLKQWFAPAAAQLRNLVD